MPPSNALRLVLFQQKHDFLQLIGSLDSGADTDHPGFAADLILTDDLGAPGYATTFGNGRLNVRHALTLATLPYPL